MHLIFTFFCLSYFHFPQRKRAFGCILFGQAALVFSEFSFNRVRRKNKMFANFIAISPNLNFHQKTCLFSQVRKLVLRGSPRIFLRSRRTFMEALMKGRPKWYCALRDGGPGRRGPALSVARALRRAGRPELRRRPGPPPGLWNLPSMSYGDHQTVVLVFSSFVFKVMYFLRLVVSKHMGGGDSLANIFKK